MKSVLLWLVVTVTAVTCQQSFQQQQQQFQQRQFQQQQQPFQQQQSFQQQQLQRQQEFQQQELRRQQQFQRQQEQQQRRQQQQLREQQRRQELQRQQQLQQLQTTTTTTTEKPKTTGRLLKDPVKDLCLNRPKQWKFNDHYYYFSWDQVDYLNELNANLSNGEPIIPRNEKVDWLKARNDCRQRCMDAVSMQSLAENDMVFDFIKTRNVSYVWTSGRLCDFTGCEKRLDLIPLNVLGWFWSDSEIKMAPTNSTPPSWDYQPWSQTGHTKSPQPDNAEFDINQTPESCMSVLNNVYQDGIKWHDIACYHKKPYICEDSDKLIKYIEAKERVKLYP